MAQKQPLKQQSCYICNEQAQGLCDRCKKPICTPHERVGIGQGGKAQHLCSRCDDQDMAQLLGLPGKPSR
jgi:hypothetical protein